MLQQLADQRMFRNEWPCMQFFIIAEHVALELIGSITNSRRKSLMLVGLTIECHKIQAVA